MLTVQINNEKTIRKLQEIAERKNLPVETVLDTIVDQYPSSDTPIQEINPDEVRQRVRRKAFAKARQYWESVGDAAKASLTDEELEEQFAVFDEEGIPRLKSEMKTLEPPVGSLAYAAKMAREANIRLPNSSDASRADEILNEEFADYLLKRMRGKDAAE